MREPADWELEVMVDVADDLDVRPEESEILLEALGVLDAGRAPHGPAERAVVPDPPVDEPVPPAAAAEYVVDALDRQDSDMLRELADYALKRAAWLDRDVEPDEIDAGDGEEIVDVEKDGEKGSIVKKKIPCGKDCKGCPHGPYKYRVYREGDSVKTEYIGAAEE